MPGAPRAISLPRAARCFSHANVGRTAVNSSDAEPVTIVVDDAHSVSALLLVPPRARACYLFAHGAGAGMTHPFLAVVATELAERGIATLRYQFPYMEQRARRPDPPKLAHATVRAAVGEAARLVPELPLIRPSVRRTNAPRISSTCTFRCCFFRERATNWRTCNCFNRLSTAWAKARRCSSSRTPTIRFTFRPAAGERMPTSEARCWIPLSAGQWTWSRAVVAIDHRTKSMIPKSGRPFG